LEEALVWISPAAVSDAMFSADGNRIVTVDANHAITFSELQTGAQLLTTYGNHAALSQDGMWLATSDEDHGITLWNVSAKQQPFTFPSVRGDGEVAFSRDSQRIAVAILDRALVWSTKTGQLLLDAPATPHSRVEQFSISADGKRFAMIDDSGSVRILDFDTGRIIQSVGRNPSNGGSHTNRACRLAWSDDGKRLATMDDRSIDLWDAVTGAKLFTLDQHAPRAGHVPLLAGNAEDEKTPAGLAIGFARDGKSIATCWRGVASVWDTSTGRRLRKLTSNDFLDRTELSPDGSRLLTCAEGEAKIWDLTEGRLSLTFAGRDALSSAVFSPDGKRVAGLGAKALRIWDAVTGAPLETIEGKFSSPTFSPDGFTIAAGAADGTVRIWDTATGEELLTLHGHPSQVWHVSNQELPEPAGAAGFAFSSDGKQLAVGGTPYLRVYAIDTNDVLKLARERLFRPLSAEDCRKFLHTQSCPAF
jgi:WD40 repeat protein